MPTGYTATLAEGEQSFEDFVLTCCRAFGACIEQRDDPLSDAPKLVQKDSYHETALAKAKQSLADFENLSESEQVAAGEDQRQDNIKRFEAKIEENKRKRARYEDMLAKVNSWTPPTAEHTELKNFMISQLKQSIDFDCGGDYYENELQKMRRSNGKKESKKIYDQLKWEVKYHQDELKKEGKRNDGRNDWIVAVYNSLNMEIPK